MASDGDRQESPSESSWVVEVDADRCSLCEVCGRRCGSGAIRSEQTGDTLAILFDHQLCDGCRDCIKSCPEEAMVLTETETPSEVSDGKVLAAGEMLKCSVCGTRFAPGAKLEAASRRRGDDVELVREQCPLCRRTQMVARFIEEKREASGKKAEYRTGKKWRWKPVVEGDVDAPPCPQTPDSPQSIS